MEPNTSAVNHAFVAGVFCPSSWGGALLRRWRYIQIDLTGNNFVVAP
jgi:hypothetical protein